MQAKGARAIQTKNAILTAYSHSVTAGSAKVSFSETVNGMVSGSNQQVTVTGQGVTDLRQPKGDLTISIPLDGDSVELRTLNDLLYVKLPTSLQSASEQNKPWVSLNLNKVAEQKYGETLSQLMSSTETPTQSLSYLRSVSTTGLVKEGSATIGSVPTTEYRAVISFKKAASELSGPSKTALQNAERVMHVKSLPVKVWVDGNDLVRQISYHLGIGNPSASGISLIDATVNLSGYGTPVDVSAPPISETYDVTNRALAALSSLGQSGTSSSGANSGTAGTNPGTTRVGGPGS